MSDIDGGPAGPDSDGPGSHGPHSDGLDSSGSDPAGAAGPTADDLARLAALFAGEPIEVAGPTPFARLSPEEAEVAWGELAVWVAELCRRFPHLDHHVVPACWWRHPGHVEVLVALRDHERASFSPAAPGTASFEWIRALREATELLRTWTGDLACGTVHAARVLPRPEPDTADLAAAIAEDVARRRAGPGRSRHP